jgi:hypothetical protein
MAVGNTGGITRHSLYRHLRKVRSVAFFALFALVVAHLPSLFTSSTPSAFIHLPDHRKMPVELRRAREKSARAQGTDSLVPGGSQPVPTRPKPTRKPQRKTPAPQSSQVDADAAEEDSESSEDRRRGPSNLAVKTMSLRPRVLHQASQTTQAKHLGRRRRIRERQLFETLCQPQTS